MSALAAAPSVGAQPKSHQVKAKKLLTDIDGTTSDCTELHNFIKVNFVEVVIAKFKAHTQVVRDNIDSVKLRYHTPHDSVNDIAMRLLAWMNDPAKKTDVSLKALEGEVLKDYFEKGNKGHVFNDVPKMLLIWKRAGKAVSCYTTGSVEAQKLLFAKNAWGDLSPFIEQYFDGTVGQKDDPNSYIEIAKRMKKIPEEILLPGEILFTSDSDKELIAAKKAGMQVVRVNRTGQPIPESKEYATVTSLEEIELL